MQGEIDMLERDLVLLSRAVRYPPAPEMAGTVAGRLGERRGLFAAPAWRLAGAAVAAVVAVALLVAAITPARQAVADFFDRIDIFRTEGLPPGITYEIKGRETTLEEAQATVGFNLALPAGREPSRVLLQEFKNVRVAVLFIDPDGGPGYALFETSAVVGKGIPLGEPDAQPVTGLGGQAYWLTGLHIVQYENDRGDIFYQSQRATDQNTLIWSRNGHVFRIEGPLDENAAVEIAKGLR